MLILKTAKQIAIDNGNKLLPWCEVLNVAGSIRRGKPEVGGIEIICVPKRVKSGAVDLWGQDDRKEVVHPDFVKVVMSLGQVLSGKPDGRYMKIMVKNTYAGAKEIQLDLFMPQRNDYYRQYAIRTGSADYTQKVIAAGWRKKGWVGCNGDLRLESECEGTQGADGKMKWKCIVKNPTLPPAWGSEEEFFQWIGVPFLPPSARYVQVLT